MSVNDFRNEPVLDFSLPEEATRFQKALESVRGKAQRGELRAVPLIGGKEHLEGTTVTSSLNPSQSTEALGEVHFASIPHATDALAVLSKGQHEWAHTSFEYRAELLRKLANLMRADRRELAALMVLEAGKPWGEADADVCEAIDFCDYYAELACEMSAPQHLMPFLNGETNHYSYAPRGVSVVISPWNFPLAIAAGMTVASLVCGNTTVLKPAEQTSLIGAELARLIYQAGIPHSAFAFLPGIGEEVGAYLVKHEDVHLVCFTGSRQVGLEILRHTSQVAHGQHHVKKVILELGGKNAIIVDEDADFDEAVKGVLYSAFGFAGQKCSACSRVIVLQDAYERFTERLIEAAHDLIVAPAEQPQAFLGPLIDAESQTRVQRLIEERKSHLTVGCVGECPDTGFFVPVTIFRDVPTTDPLWREEAFAPVLCIRSAETFQQAIAMANDSDYALTGGVYSRSPSNLDIARSEFQVGNLYLNRGITGAIVGRQPFGGFRLSGIGSKAGGPDYLLQFVEPRTVTENTMRKGFTPELAQ